MRRARPHRLFLLILGLVLALPAAASAAEGSGCAAAAWPLAADGARLQAAGLPRIASGASLAPDGPTAFVLALVPIAEAGLPTPPERASGTGAGFAGFVRLAPPQRDGMLQITLDQAAWIDLVQDGKALKPTAFTGVRDCPLARKSVRFSLTAADGPVLLQLSGAAAETLRIALTAVQ